MINFTYCITEKPNIIHIDHASGAFLDDFTWNNNSILNVEIFENGVEKERKAEADIEKCRQKVELQF